MTGTAVTTWSERPLPEDWTERPLAEDWSITLVNPNRVALSESTIARSQPGGRYALYWANVIRWKGFGARSQWKKKAASSKKWAPGLDTSAYHRAMLARVFANWAAVEEGSMRIALEAIETSKANVKARPTTLAESTQFIASRTLVGIWRRGVEFYAKATEQNSVATQLNSLTVLDTDNLRRIMGTQIVEAIIGEVRFARDKTPKTVTFINEKGQFEPLFEALLAEQFQVQPLDISDFIRTLCAEWVQFLGTGNSLSGNWGKLEFEGEQAVFHLNPLLRNEAKRPPIPRPTIEPLA